MKLRLRAQLDLGPIVRDQRKKGFQCPICKPRQQDGHWYREGWMFPGTSTFDLPWKRALPVQLYQSFAESKLSRRQEESLGPSCNGDSCGALISTTPPGRVVYAGLNGFQDRSPATR
jgi:hypothetical protein